MSTRKPLPANPGPVLAKLVEQGWTYREIQNEYTIGYYKLRTLLREQGAEKNREVSPRATASLGQRAAYLAGLSFREIGELWGVKYTTIHGRLCKAQVPIRPRGGNQKPSNSATIEHYRKVAQDELAN